MEVGPEGQKTCEGLNDSVDLLEKLDVPKLATPFAIFQNAPKGSLPFPAIPSFWNAQMDLNPRFKAPGLLAWCWAECGGEVGSQ